MIYFSPELTQRAVWGYVSAKTLRYTSTSGHVVLGLSQREALGMNPPTLAVHS